MANCSQINNTTIIGTSAITYSSTPLPCTDVKTCDGLNTILDKFNSVICNVAADVALLTEDITNITEDLMILSEDVIIINNRLNICCPTTTTTSSSTSTSSTTTTTTTVVNYVYRIAQSSCITCEPLGGYLRRNSGPLTVGKFYYDDFTGLVFEILEFIGTTTLPSEFNINIETIQDNCVSVICSPSTTTTTAVPTTTTTSSSSTSTSTSTSTSSTTTTTTTAGTTTTTTSAIIYYTFNLTAGTVGCVGGAITFNSIGVVTVYSNSSVLANGVALYTTPALTTLITYSAVKSGTTVYELNAGVIDIISTVGGAC